MVVFIGAAVIIAGLFIGFLVSWDTKETYEGVKTLMGDGPKGSYAKVDRLGFVVKVHELWDECALGTIEKKVPLYVTPQKANQKEELTKEFMFEELKKINYCKSLQSAEFGCGTREDVEMEDISLPSVVSLACEDGLLTIEQ